MSAIYQALLMSCAAANAPASRYYRGIVERPFRSHSQFCFCYSDGPGTLDFTQVRYFPPLWRCS